MVFRILYHKKFCFPTNWELVGLYGLKRILKNTPNVNACAEMHFQMKIPDLSASTNPKKAHFSSNSIFKLYSSNSIFNLKSPPFFRQIAIAIFQIIKILLKLLKTWVWRTDFELFWKDILARKMSRNERIFMFLSSSIGKMETNKIAESFPTFQIVAFEVW